MMFWPFGKDLLLLFCLAILQFIETSLTDGDVSIKILWMSGESDLETAREVGMLAADSQFVLFLDETILAPVYVNVHKSLREAIANQCLKNMDRENFFVVPVCDDLICAEVEALNQSYFDEDFLSFPLEVMLIFNKVTSKVNFQKNNFIISRQYAYLPARTFFIAEGAFVRNLTTGGSEVRSFLEFNSIDQQTRVSRVLDLRWDYWVENYEKNLNEAQYCMLWCKNDDEIFLNGSNVYRDSPRHQHYAVEYQSGGERATGLRCCQIATRESFSVIFDSTQQVLRDDDEITMVTFGSIDRVEALREHRVRWKGPLVFVMYSIDYNDHLMQTNYRLDAEKLGKIATNEEWQDTLILQYIALYDKDRNVLRELQNYEVVSVAKSNTSEIDCIVPDFPINSLRNVAMDHAKTRFVMANDVDFLTGYESYDVLKSHLKLLRSTDKVALSVPPFQKRSCYPSLVSDSTRYPERWSELDLRLRQGGIRPWGCDLERWIIPLELNSSQFSGSCHSGMDNAKAFYFCDAVSLHNYPEYFNLSSKMVNSSLVFLDNASNTEFETRHFEPYVVQSRVTVDGPLIRYNELFISRGFNKVSFISSLRKLHCLQEPF
eukprot:TRINITY_DN3445_c0_g1_i8.p1 TRINITY_DN3445_c0_g1~~TRINITY_DN3445_c0_g1_i8.p1  ORF type:complete len:603 (-),score=135.64 TRINITY_DN3445_c0_g1_i8:823-2631(-)